MTIGVAAAVAVAVLRGSGGEVRLQLRREGVENEAVRGVEHKILGYEAGGLRGLQACVRFQ